MGVDIANILRAEVGILEGRLDASCSAAPLGVACGDWVGVGRCPVTRDLGADRGAAPPSMFQFLQDQDASPLAQNKAVAAEAERGATRDLARRCSWTDVE